MTPLQFDYPISVAVLYYHDTSAGDMVDEIECAEAIAEALESQGHRVRLVPVNKKNWLKAVQTPGDVVFNQVQDETWELYMKVAKRLDYLGKAQFGIDRQSLKFVLKKAFLKRKLQRLGLSTPKFKIYNRASKFTDNRSLEYPVIVKPSGTHAGLGISQDSVVIDRQELEERVKYLFKNYSGEVVAEEYIEGREIHVSVIGNGRRTITLPYAELEFKGAFADNWDIYTYNAKWEEKSWEYWDARVGAPAKVSRKLDAKIEKLALKAYRALGCRDITRFDMRIDAKDNVYILDVNLCPSINPKDDQDATLKSIEALDWTYEEFVETLVAICYKRVYGRLPDRTRERSFMLASPKL